MQTPDVVVIGGGPAGTSAAISLVHAGLAVVVLERSQYDVDRIGESLPPEAAGWLSRLGVDVAGIPSVESPGVVSLWGTSTVVDTDFLFTPEGEGRHFDRRALDAALAAAAIQAGARLLTGVRVQACRREGDRWHVQAGDSGYAPYWVVDATGRRGQLVNRRIRADKLIAATVRVTGVTHRDRRLALEAAEDGWWYFAPLPNGGGIAAWLTDADLFPVTPEARATAWHAKLAATQLISQRTTGTEAGSIKVVPAGMSSAVTVTGDGWVAAGDAALAPDPLSGWGVTAAMRGGWEAGVAVHRALTGDDSALGHYREWVTETIQDFTSERTAQYARVHQWSDKLFWARRRPAQSSSVKQ